MPAVERAVDRGARLGREAVAKLCEELRRARMAAGITQADVARTLRTSRSKYGRMERGSAPSVSIVDLSRAFAVVGLELSARGYPSGSPIRDRGHLVVLERFRIQLPSTSGWRTEAAFPNQDDLRSWDGFLRQGDLAVGVECEMRPTDWQELSRRIHRKKRDGGVDRVILLLPDTRSNRAFVADHGSAILASFPVPGHVALAALREGRDPGGDALILL